MSTTNEKTTTTTSSAESPEKIRPDVGYVRTIPGYLKIVEIILDIIVIICAPFGDWFHLGGGWVLFVAVSALVTTIIFFIFHFFQLTSRIHGCWDLIEVIYYVIYIILFLIAAIVSAVRAPLEPSICAACFFCFAAVVVYTVDVVFMYRNWKKDQHSSHSYTKKRPTSI